MSTTPLVLSADELAILMGCSTKTIEDKARAGSIPGLLWGDGGWVFPVKALYKRLNESAIEQSLKRRQPSQPLAVAALTPGRRRREPAQLPDLEGLGSARTPK